MGRGFIDRFEVGRAALAEAQGRMEMIASRPASDTLCRIYPTGQYHMSYFRVGGRTLGTELWTVIWKDDPADNPNDPNQHDLREATVTVRFQHGEMPDSVRLTRLLPPI
jgi:hypothetical protein